MTRFDGLNDGEILLYLNGDDGLHLQSGVIVIVIYLVLVYET